ncbi:MAG: DMT family transporter [Caldiserica bacterium]|nr:DMT family transporter [Caldisericota bacterium]
MKNRTLTGYIAIVIAMAIWSFTFIWTKEILDANACTPLTIIVVRLVISVMLMFPFAMVFRQFEKIDKKDRILLVLLGFFQPFVYFIGETFGQMTVSPTITSVIISTIPLFTPFAVALFFKEKVIWTNIAGIVVSFVGVYMLLIKENMEIIVDPKGIALLFLAVFSAVIYSVIIHKLVGKYKPLTILMWQNAIGLACYIPWFAATDLVPVLTKGIPVAYIDNLLLLGILGSTVAYLLFIYSVQAITIWLVNAFANLIPVLTAFFAYLVLGEKLLPVGMAGVAVAILGLFISQIKTKSAAPITENY